MFVALLVNEFGFHLHNVAVTEILWTLFGLVGLGFAVSNFLVATEDVRYAVSGHPQDKAVVALAQGHVRTELNRCLIHSIVMLVGFLAMLSPPTSHSPVTPVGILVTVGLFAISGITISQSILDRRLRSLLTSFEREASDA